MKQLLWLKFYPKDWNGDHNLRACSLAARGLLASLLEPMHEAEPYGHLLVRGKKPEYHDLAVIASCSVREVKYGVEELVKHHVLSQNDAGILYSRRMVRDADRRVRQALGGTRGIQTRRRILEPLQHVAGANLRVDLERTSSEQGPPIETRDQRLEKSMEPTENVSARKPAAKSAEKAPGVREFLTWFQGEYKARRNGAVYFVKWEAHGAIVKRLLTGHSIDRLKKHAQILLRSNEEWIDSTDRGIEVLSGKINWLEERLCAWETERKSREAV